MTEVISKINMAIHVLNHIDTCGKQNLLNLGGAIDLLENIVAELGQMQVAEKGAEKVAEE